MPRTILHLIDTGGPGGAETVFLELVTRLNAQRWRNVAVVPSRDWLDGALRERGVEPVHLPSRGSFDLRYLAGLHRIASKHRALLIQTHLLTTCVYGSAVGRLRRIPVVSTLHGAVDLPPRDRFRRLKLRIANRRGNRVVFVSEPLRRSILEREPIPEAATAVIPNGIDVNTYRPGRDATLRGELGLAAGDMLVGAVGNVRKSKDYANLLRTAAWLRDQGVACRFVVAGDTRSGGLYEALLRLRGDLRLEDTVRFVGFQEDVVRILHNCDLYVLSSEQEGFSLTTVQAMACGVATVATRCGGPEEIITDGHDGLLVPPANAAALGRAIQSLTADPARRACIAAAGRRTVEERYGIEAMVDAYGRLYDELLGLPPVSRSAPAVLAMPVSAEPRRA